MMRSTTSKRCVCVWCGVCVCTHICNASLPSQSLEEMDPTTAALEREHEALTKIKYIDRVQIGK